MFHFLRWRLRLCIHLRCGSLLVCLIVRGLRLHLLSRLRHSCEPALRHY